MNYIKDVKTMYIRALTSGVLNTKILAFNTPNTKKTIYITCSNI